MNLHNQLLRQAGKFAGTQTVRRIELSAEMGRLEGRRSLSEAERAELEEVRIEAENCAQALLRFGTYRPQNGADANCPYCWVVHGVSSPLRAGASPETYQCSECQTEYP